MENILTVHSQVLVQPSRGRRIFIKILWACVIFMIIAALISFVASGFKVGVLLSCAVPVMILSRFTSMPQSVSHYESDLAYITFESDSLNISYQRSGGAGISVLYRDIKTVEHSAQMHCFRLAFPHKVEGATNGDYHLLYMEDERVSAFAKMLAEHTEIPVQYLD